MGYGMWDFGFRIHPILDLGLLISDMGFRISDIVSVANHIFLSRYWPLDTGYSMLDN
jgi:hypothetical protein